MRTLILYESKHGATKKVAELLGEKIENSVVAKISNFFGKLHKYDKVIVGGPIYAGRLNPVVKKYIEKNGEHIHSAFISGMRHENAEAEIKDNFSEEFLSKRQVEFVGGAYNISDMNFLEKLIVRVVAKTKYSKEEFNYENIDKLVKGLTVR